MPIIQKISVPLKNTRSINKLEKTKRSAKTGDLARELKE
jgi:hypothetical protein